MQGDLRRTEGDDTVDENVEVLSLYGDKMMIAIGEVKDRISLIEFTFCNGILPHVRSLPRSIMKQCEEEWRIKLSSAHHQIEEIRLQRDQAEEETKLAISSLHRERAEKAKILEDLENAERIDEVTVLKDEVEQCKQLQEKLLRQIDEIRLQKKKAEEENKRAIDNLQRAHEKEKARILERLESSEKSAVDVADLKDQVRNMADEARHYKRLQETLLRQIDQKDLALSEEKSKVKKLSSNWGKMEERYKLLKSQYTFLLRKTGLTGETISPISISQKRKRPQDDQIPSNTHKFGENVVTPISMKAKEPIQEMIDKNVQSPWVDTRSADAQDDFLDTALEAVRAASNRKSRDETVVVIAEIDAPATKVDSRSEKGFKFVDSVRKKAERENLKGIECKQCKKFYDSVLPGDGRDPSELRCEHHEGVSRHRYRHPPPMTPEGFWNIGFDSES